MKSNSYLYITCIIGLFLAATGCNGIFDDLSQCPQGVDFHFYSQTACANKPSYPSTMDEMHLFVFDDKEILVEEYIEKNVKPAPDYKMRTLFHKKGTFSIVAWGGANDDSYAFSSFEKGKTTRNQLLLQLKHNAGKVDKQPHALFFGTTDSPLTIVDRSQEGTEFSQVSINLTEITNRLNFTINGLPETENYSITISDDNGAYSFRGEMIPGTRIHYVADVAREGSRLKAAFTVMQLGMGRDARLHVVNTRTKREVYSVNIVEGLIMNPSSGSPPYNLLCEHDFDITLTLKDTATVFDAYMALKVTINGWTIILNPVILPSP